MMEADKPRYIRYSTYLGDVDVMSAWYVKQVFAKHWHEGYGIGTITSGAMKFYYRGENLTAAPGYLNSVNPDEVHDGHSYDNSGWRYNMFYFKENVFRNIYNDISDSYATPFIAEGVMNDRELAIDIANLTGEMLSCNSDRLYVESALTSILSRTIYRHTDKRPDVKPVYKLGTKLKRVKSYINENLNSGITISKLASVAGVSPFHFIRSFGEDVGLAPYEYVASLRAAKAKDMVLSGVRYADAAAECGYSDQSHMNRWLKRIYGLTPKRMSIAPIS